MVVTLAHKRMWVNITIIWIPLKYTLHHLIKCEEILVSISCDYVDNNITFMILKILTRPNLQTFAQQTTWSLQYHNCRNWKPWHPILSFQLVDVLRHSLLPRKIHLWKKNGYANISISMNKCKYLEFQSFVFEKWKNQ